MKILIIYLWLVRLVGRLAGRLQRHYFPCEQLKENVDLTIWFVVIFPILVDDSQC